MPEAPRSTPRNAIGSLALIAAVVAVAAAAFAYTAGWFSPGRLTPQKLVDAFDLRSPPPLGHRRNHAKEFASRACSSRTAPDRSCRGLGCSLRAGTP